MSESSIYDKEKMNATAVWEALSTIPATLLYSVPLVLAVAGVDYIGTMAKDYLPTARSVMQYQIQNSLVDSVADVSKISLALQASRGGR